MSEERGLDIQATASTAERQLSDRDIRDAELERARHALAYLKGKLGNSGMRALVADDLEAMRTTVRGWVEVSGGAWRTASLELSVPGPSALEFQAWYIDAMVRGREADRLISHRDHRIASGG